MDYETIFQEACDAARLAVKAEIAREPENENTLDCGFAWVTVPGNEGLARWCRDQKKRWKGSQIEAAKFGDKGYPSGWQFWKPGNFNGQSIRIHEVGAKAFRDVLARHGIRADVGSRYD